MKLSERFRHVGAYFDFLLNPEGFKQRSDLHWLLSILTDLFIPTVYYRVHLVGEEALAWSLSLWHGGESVISPCSVYSMSHNLGSKRVT